MGLAEMQSALARLYTSAEARAELRRDDRGFAEHHHLSKAEAEALAGSVLNEAEDFARALVRKRYAEAVKAIPAAQNILGSRMDNSFSSYAAATPLGRERNPAIDALAFLRWLVRERRNEFSLSEIDGFRYEEARLLMQQTGRRLMVRWLQVPEQGAASRSLVVWWRWNGRLRCLISG